MASLSFSSLPTSTTTNKPFLFSKPSFTHSNQFKVSCTAADNNENPDILPKSSSFERRNLLLGMGGLYGAANIPSAFGTAIEAPDMATSCVNSSGLKVAREAIRGLSCCPPLSSDPLNDIPRPYTFPAVTEYRVRKPAHYFTPTSDYTKKFNKAILTMKGLPDSDPHSWKNQAKIHCAYCNSGYTQEKTGHPEYTIQVHNSWLFLPFHRWYLYFLEKIIGKYTDPVDDDFALPYWNWDNPEGMMLPAMYEGDIKDKDNAIFDALREPSHLPPAIFDFNYGGTDLGLEPKEQKDINLALMYRQMIGSGSSTLTFMGGKLRAGLDPTDEKKARGLSLGGSLENGVHTGAHRWVGNHRMPNGEDMGNFYSAGFDPLFYGHHANVDRMWNVWKDVGVKLGRPGHIDPADEDWREASYVFYDENKVRVRVYNKDCVNTRKMGYIYEKAPTPWITKRPLARPREGVNVAKDAYDEKSVKNVTDKGVLPLTLDKKTPVRFLVTRPIEAIDRTPEAKKEKNEMVCLNNIKYSCQKFIRFNVLVNYSGKKPVDKVNAGQAEFVGSFAQLPHNTGGEDMLMDTSEEFGITELMEDTKAEGDGYILVTIVPVVGCEGLIIPDINIELVAAVPDDEITQKYFF